VFLAVDLGPARGDDCILEPVVSGSAYGDLFSRG